MKIKKRFLCASLLVSHLFVGILVAIYNKSGNGGLRGNNLPSCNFKSPIIHTRAEREERGGEGVESHSKTVFVITPTYKRVTQKVDLLTLCHSLSLSRTQVKWIVIEDSKTPTPLVSGLLSRCPVPSVHLSVRTPRKKSQLWWFQKLFMARPVQHHKGIEQRNIALQWLRHNFSTQNCHEGVVYFADDDNRYHYKLFNTISQTIKASVWPVGFAGHILYEGPVCYNNTVTRWKSWAVNYDPKRSFPIDMAGFAINLCFLFEKPSANFNSSWDRGQLETGFLYQFLTSKEELECRGSDKEVHVWHVKTAKPSVSKSHKLEHFLET